MPEYQSRNQRKIIGRHCQDRAMQEAANGTPRMGLCVLDNTDREAGATWIEEQFPHTEHLFSTHKLNLEHNHTANKYGYFLQHSALSMDVLKTLKD